MAQLVPIHRRVAKPIPGYARVRRGLFGNKLQLLFDTEVLHSTSLMRELMTGEKDPRLIRTYKEWKTVSLEEVVAFIKNDDEFYFKM